MSLKYKSLSIILIVLVIFIKPQSSESKSQFAGPLVDSIKILPDSSWKELKPYLLVGASSGNDSIKLSFAEYFIDSTGSNFMRIPLLPKDGVFDSTSEYLVGKIDQSGLTLGDHILFLHVVDSIGNWSDFVEVPFHIINQEEPSNWNFYGGNIFHDGYNRADTIKVPLRLKWQKPLTENQLNYVTGVNSSIYATSQYYLGNRKAWSLNLLDGELNWEYDLGSIYSISPVGFSGGYLVFQSNNHLNDSYVHVMDQEGNLKWKKAFHPQWGSYLSPVISNDIIFITYYGSSDVGLIAYDLITGEELWDYLVEDYGSDWHPAIFDSVIYTSSKNKLNAIDIGTGLNLWSINNIPFIIGQHLDIELPVIDTTTKNMLVTSKDFLTAINLATRSIVWTIEGIFGTPPAVKDGRIYIINNQVLNVFDLNNGDLINEFTGNRHIIHPPVLTNDYLFISSNTHVYALDPEDLSKKWDYLIGGKITVTNNHLLLSASNGVVYCFENDPTVGVSDQNSSVPETFQLFQNYPNPFNSHTIIKYSLPENALVKIQIYDLMGQEIKTLFEKNEEAGTHTFNFYSEDFASGIYFYRLKANNYNSTKKLILLK